MIRNIHSITALYRWSFALSAALVFSPLAINAQTNTTKSDAACKDSVVMQTVLYFSPNNGDWIERSEYRKVGNFLRWALQDTLSQIRLSGWADGKGTEAFNERISFRRARTVHNYLVRKGVATDRIRSKGCGVDRLAASNDEARRVELAGFVCRSTAIVEESQAPCEKNVTITDGHAAEAPVSADTVQTEPAPQQEITQRAQTVAPQPEQPLLTTVETEAVSPRYVALKTNLAAWAGTILNIAADVQVAGHVSVELPVLWCPWYVSGEHAVKTFTIQPEARYWLTKPGEGHFFGLHAHMGWFNVKWNRDRYQDADRPLLGAGISYGYLLPFNEHWAGEFTLGAGYANMRYDTYYNIDNGARIDTRTKNYWGITRVGISVVYRFNIKK